jgi:hypothetical protein
MKFIFFTITEYPGFSGSELEKLLIRCGAKIYVSGTGADLVVMYIEDQSVEKCVRGVLNMAGIYYYEMEGVPRVLRFRSPYGRIIAEVKFA